MDKKDIVIIGAGGFAKEVLWLLEQINNSTDEWNILGFVDKMPSSNQNKVHGYSIVGDDKWLEKYEDPIHVVCAIGSPTLRKQIIQRLKNKRNIIFPNIISEKAILSDKIDMGEGCIVCASSIVTVDVKLGNFVIINLDCTIGHDAILDDFVTIYPSVNVSGNVTIASETEVGTGTNIIQGISIGNESIIGAGAVVIRDIKGYCTAVGNPAKEIKYKKTRTDTI